MSLSSGQAVTLNEEGRPSKPRMTYVDVIDQGNDYADAALDEHVHKERLRLHYAARTTSSIDAAIIACQQVTRT
jgi:hypothetical protein